ncbi:MAG: VWA domain-containing protein [Acidobacteria bacterium]|nr:VWA domain-containing protein [Acidobacteriota bacterium]
MRSTVPLRLALISAVAVAALFGAGIQAQAGAHERTLFVSVVDAQGEPVEALGPADFIITEDGRRRETLRVSRASEPMDIALLADNSAAASRAIPSLRAGLRGFVAAMGGSHQIALIALADRPTIVVDYTSNRTRLDEGIGRLFAMDSSGMTLLDGLVETSAGLRRRDTTRAVIVPVITTGTEFTNRFGRDVVDALQQAGVALHALVIGELDIASVPERERLVVLEAGTRETGGRHVTLLTESAVGPALQKLARQLSSQYKVVYGRPESLIPPEKTEVASARPGLAMRGTPARGQRGV